MCTQCIGIFIIFWKMKFFSCPGGMLKLVQFFLKTWKKNLTGRIRTIDLGITAKDIYSPPLYQLSYGELQ